MRFTSRGIGWLIAGAIICATAADSDDLISAAGTLLIGLTFAAVYFMKQRFTPKGIGWFIAGGILTAFTVESALGEISRTISTLSLGGSDISTVLIGAVIACSCFFAFYRQNRRGVYDLAAEMGIDMPEPQEEEPTETVAEPITGSPAGTGAEPLHHGSEVEFEIAAAGEDRSIDVDTEIR